MPRLLVNADDFGLHADIDRGILRALEAGRVQSISMSMIGASADFHLARELTLSGVRIGLHLTFVEVPWKTRNLFLDSWKSFARMFLLGGREFRQAVEVEARWQLRKALDEGIVLSHLDGHQHLHVLPGVWPICYRLAQEQAIPRVRVSASASWRLIKPNLSGIVLQTCALRCGRRLPGYLRCLGLACAGSFSLDNFEREMRAVAGSQHDLELVVHPGIANDGASRAFPHWPFDWRKELDALLDPRFVEILDATGYRLADSAAYHPVATDAVTPVSAMAPVV